jgi:hypothetical protein
MLLIRLASCCVTGHGFGGYLESFVLEFEPVNEPQFVGSASITFEPELCHRLLLEKLCC